MLRSLQRGHYREDIERFQHDWKYQFDALLRLDERHHPSLKCAPLVPRSRLLTQDELAEIASQYPRLIPGDAVYFPDALIHPVDPTCTIVYDRAIVRQIKMKFPNKCVKEASFWLWNTQQNQLCRDAAGNPLTVDLDACGAIISEQVDFDAVLRRCR